jgi:hypothetical protein
MYLGFMRIPHCYIQGAWISIEDSGTKLPGILGDSYVKMGFNGTPCAAVTY